MKKNKRETQLKKIKNNENKKLLYTTKKRNIKRQNTKGRSKYGRSNFHLMKKEPQIY